MDTSHLLARIIGIVFIVMYGGILLNHKFYRHTWQDLSKQPLSLFLSGFIALISGLLVVHFHSIWTLDWRGLITLLGWIMVLMGVVRILFPERVLKMTQKLADKKESHFLTIGSIMMLLIGLYLTAMSFS